MKALIILALIIAYLFTGQVITITLAVVKPQTVDRSGKFEWYFVGLRAVGWPWLALLGFLYLLALPAKMVHNAVHKKGK